MCHKGNLYYRLCKDWKVCYIQVEKNRILNIILSLVHKGVLEKTLNLKISYVILGGIKDLYSLKKGGNGFGYTNKFASCFI